MSPVANPSADYGCLGDFEIVREIGRGGMGIVFEARQVSLNRRVALKVLAGNLGLTARAIERFQREAEAAAKLHHTNIVPIYATGNQDDTHFYAMELIDGPSLDRVIHKLRRDNKAGDLDPADSAVASNLLATLTMSAPNANPPARAEGAEASSSALTSDSGYFDTVARMIADVADALEHAHGQGVIHRDVKPSNLLLSADGRLSLNDFGLARLLERPGMTITGEFVGTPAYMSPEQITAGRIPLDKRTDIYSLGATLYELLTLQAPFTGERRDQVLAQIVQKDPRPPRKLNRKVPVDLETICLKALEKDPDRRYQTAGQMAEDLRRYVNRFAIKARRAGPLDRLKKWLRRHPALAGASAIAFVAALAVVYFAYHAHVTRAQLRAEMRKSALERTTEAAMRGKFTEAEHAIDDAIALGASTGEVRFLRGQIELHQGNIVKAMEHLEEAARLLPESVAAQAALVRAYYDAGHFDRFYSKVFRLFDMAPESAEDHLFLGQVTAYQNPARALPLLDRAIDMRDGALPRLVRADVRTKYAQMTGLPEDAERALDDVHVAQTMLPGDPLVLTASLEAHLVAACTYDRQNQADKKRAELIKAGKDADDLKTFNTFPKALRARMIYLVYAGKDEAIRAEYLFEKEQNGGAVTGRYFFHQLYRQGKFSQALEVVDHMPRPGNEAMYHMRRIFVLANFAKDGPARAWAEYQEALQTGGRGYLPIILLFLGKKAEATAMSRKVAERATTDFWNQKGNEFLGGLLSAEKLLEAAGDSQWWRCEGHFFIGMVQLSEGNRAGARRHFEAAVATNVLWFLEYEWSRSFLARMVVDPAWPAWIPLKK